jgi:hypothetical protein
MWNPKLSSSETLEEHLRHGHHEHDNDHSVSEKGALDVDDPSFTVLGGAFSNTTSAEQDVTRDDIPLTVHSNLSIKEQV